MILCPMSDIDCVWVDLMVGAADGSEASSGFAKVGKGIDNSRFVVADGFERGVATCIGKA